MIFSLVENPERGRISTKKPSGISKQKPVGINTVSPTGKTIFALGQ
jgi:hypothetical protein